MTPVDTRHCCGTSVDNEHALDVQIFFEKTFERICIHQSGVKNDYICIVVFLRRVVAATTVLLEWIDAITDGTQCLSVLDIRYYELTADHLQKIQVIKSRLCWNICWHLKIQQSVKFCSCSLADWAKSYQMIQLNPPCAKFETANLSEENTICTSGRLYFFVAQTHIRRTQRRTTTGPRSTFWLAVRASSLRTTGNHDCKLIAKCNR